ncbi:uncharacterized protein LOC134254517 [Saccostrea cucullata]|uniref:uncharacterized protein LOC134254517 n=1 Tax=Saccostrea cuccullata TaxID=36930 RepID=UPI002ED16738
MDETGRGGCLNQQQYDIVVRFLAHGHFPSKRELLEANFASQKDSARPRPFRKFKSWMQRLLYRESENALIHLPTGKVVVPKERFVQIIVENHCELSGHLNAYATMRKIQKTYTFGRRNFGMSEDLVRSVIRNCPVCENCRTITAKLGIPFDKEGLQSIDKACEQNEEELSKTQKKSDTDLANTSTGPLETTNKDTPTTAQTTDNGNQKGKPVEMSQTDDKRNKTDVKQSHPIIHSSLLSQLMTRPGQKTNTGLSTSSSKSGSLPRSLLCPINAPLMPLLSMSQAEKQDSLAIGSSTTATQVSTSQTKVTSANASKLLDINANLGSWMAQNIKNVGYYVKVPNSSLPSGFSLSFVAAPLMHLGASTLCSPSTASMLSSCPLPSLIRPTNETAGNKCPNSSGKKEESHPQAKIAISKMATCTTTTQSQDISDKISTPTKMAIPSLAKSTKHPKSLPPIKPKEETELGKALLKPESNIAGPSNVLSTPPKIPKSAAAKKPSSGVKRKLKLKLEKNNKKLKQKKLACMKPGKMGPEKNSDEKNEKVEAEKLNDANNNPLSETSKKKKIIVINTEKMNKILQNRFNFHMNFKGKCNVNFHNEASGITTSFLVDDGQNTSVTSKTVALSSNEGTSSKVDFQNEDIKQTISDYPGNMKQEHCLEMKSYVAEGQHNAQLTEKGEVDQKTENLNNGDDNLTQDMESLVGSTSATSSDTAMTQSLSPDPCPIPSPAMWTFSEDMLAEKNSYGRLLIAIQDMRMDVMKSILCDHHAMDRLKKKICYAETLIRKHKEDRCSD